MSARPALSDQHWGLTIRKGFAEERSALGNGVTIAGESMHACPTPPLIPREVLFGNPEIIGVSLSPDGRRISYLAPKEGVLNLWVQELDGDAPARVITRQRDRPQRSAFWTADGRYLISSRDGNGDENTVLMRIDPLTGHKKDLTPVSKVKAFLIGADREAPSELVVGLNDRDPRYHDLYVIDVDSGDRRLLYRSTDDGSQVSVEWLKGAWQPVLRSQILPDGGSSFELRLPGDTNWRPFLQFNFEDTISNSGPSGFTRDGRWLYGQLSSGEDLPRLVRWSCDHLHSCGLDCTSEVVHRSSAGAFAVELNDLETGVPTVLKEVDLRSRRVVLDASVQADMDRLERLAGPNNFRVVDRDLGNRRWLVAIGSDQQGSQYWLWDREQDEIRKLFSVQPRLDAYELVSMESFDLKARDGRRLPVYLSRTPIGGSGPQPLVLLVHGGPQARDYWGFNPIHQLLANRGYHALSVNYRGSTGFGKSHLLAGEGEWYGRMQDDLVDAVRWAVAEGIADPDRLVIMGASYGGYAALSGLTRDSELFAAAIAEFGPSNVRTFLDSTPPYWQSTTLVFFKRMIGVGKVNLDAISPIQHVDRIQRPLLLGHGANDPRVKLSESETIAAAMKERQLPIDFVVFPDEGHGLVNPLNALAMYALVEAFLRNHVGGRAEPFGSSVDQSSLEWRMRSLPTTEIRSS
ncbi:dipeptidyl aminopeptidase/peptidase S9 prolyl oligopeptidase [Synechococcus sp. BIOS-E4-1]|uniref:S9 family peptidase n=1 Tax=Synechococcus sp. BIOS-E4-1 TaxID=1400864 RepID=UPI00185FC624|nr:S9 family peptidase [Synechococcus sp. BIOS-E4-1]QNI56633.1 dipeptidyl aminopeptidase/peptidase S9 prolyl oligopeptidase [Synechococcus sp. BIOS-E4-1]